MRKAPSNQLPRIEKIGLVVLRKVKHSANTYYVTVDPTIISRYEIATGDILKLGFIELERKSDMAENVNE